MIFFSRFWYESPGQFKPNQLREILGSSLARVICDNSDNIQQVQPDVFKMTSYPDGFTNCENIPELNLQAWGKYTLFLSYLVSNTPNVHMLNLKLAHVSVSFQLKKEGVTLLKRFVYIDLIYCTKNELIYKNCNSVFLFNVGQKQI